MDDYRQLYFLAQELGHARALDLARHAESQEERNFFAYVADMNLQRKQKEVIEQSLF